MMTDIDIQLRRGALYLVVLCNGRRFSAEYVGKDSQGRMAFKNSHSLVTLHRISAIELMKELGA